MSDVQVETEGHIAVMTLGRSPVNALSSAFYDEIATALEQVAGDDTVNVLVLRSASGKAFCAGADVTELAGLTGPAAEEADVRRQELARRVFGQLLALPQPSIAVVDGPAIGAGAVIASCCDMRMGSPRAAFVLPEVNVGRCGGGRHLMRHLPQGVVRRMYFTAAPLTSEEALRFGFLDSVYDTGAELEEAALERARDIAAKSPVALRLGKAALDAAEPLPVQEGYAVEQQYTLRLARTDDAREALAARREKRPPVFTGK
ncbi:enoyl-CoA hydratase-related protein [Streptomyces sp. NPDC056910]|uniref:enoyl-CoA hydratase-related protein n=1 Tax=Streptomyces sp. NPDC056910 TaxID=3345964 RepID=UPI00367B6A92